MSPTSEQDRRSGEDRRHEHPVHEYAKQWLSPSAIVAVLTGLLIVGGAWIRLSSLEKGFADLSADVKLATAADVDAAKEFIRYQGKVDKQSDEIDEQRRLIKLLEHELTKVKVALVAKGVIRPSDV